AAGPTPVAAETTPPPPPAPESAVAESASPQPTATEPVTTAPAGEIATLPPTPTTDRVGLNPRTGEPRRPWLIGVSTVSSWLAATAAGASLLWTYWVAVTDYFGSSWLTAQFKELLIWQEVLLMVALTVAVLAVAISAVITGYYAWFGHRWTRIAGIVSGVVSGLVLLLNPVGWAAIPLAIIGAGLLWTPRASSFFDAWANHRHPQTAFAPPLTSVRYGPLPRYRKD
ncbi:MAG: hypothetical protein LWW77_10040, partial [Propionibacteriales bacterium]|nr:hypothetical protein [Propionibacteriales bacterium]